jgi:hypothetical protein
MSIDHSFSGTMFLLGKWEWSGAGWLASSGRRGRINIIFPFLVDYRKSSPCLLALSQLDAADS